MLGLTAAQTGALLAAGLATSFVLRPLGSIAADRDDRTTIAAVSALVVGGGYALVALAGALTVALAGVHVSRPGGPFLWVALRATAAVGHQADPSASARLMLAEELGSWVVGRGARASARPRVGSPLVAQKKKRTRQAPSSSARTRPGSPAKARSGNPAKARKATARDWISGARIRTLPLAVAPVAIGAGAARAMGPDEGVSLGLALLCLAVAVLLQIGVNYANDYSDGVRGTDDVRVGPARLTGSGAAKPRTVLTVALTFFGLAAVAGLVIVLITGHWWLLAVGAVAIVAAYFYTGGKRPYGYAGLGDVVVFVFFGLVATAGTQFILIGMITGEGWLGGVAAGGFASAVLMVNNIRDIEQDGKVGKRTLAVRLGPRGSRIVYCIEVAIAYAVVVFFFLFYPKALLVLFTLALALPAAIIACTGRTPKELILSLQLTSMAALTFGLGLGAAFAF